MIGFILTLIVLIPPAVIIFMIAKRYLDATGTVWQRLLMATSQSATILWGYIVAFSGYLISWSEKATDFFNLPEVQQFLKDHVTPTRLGIVMVVIGIVSIVARLRTL